MFLGVGPDASCTGSSIIIVGRPTVIVHKTRAAYPAAQAPVLGGNAPARATVRSRQSAATVRRTRTARAAAGTHAFAGSRRVPGCPGCAAELRSHPPRA